MEDFKKEGKKLRELIIAKYGSIYSFAYLSKYAPSRLYRLCSGENDTRTMSLYNAVIFARLLGYKSLEEFYKALGIDIMNEF